MTVFPTLIYTSAREIPTFINSSVEKLLEGLLSSRISPYRPLEGVFPSPAITPETAKQQTTHFTSRGGWQEN